MPYNRLIDLPPWMSTISVNIRAWLNVTPCAPRIICFCCRGTVSSPIEDTKVDMVQQVITNVVFFLLSGFVWVLSIRVSFVNVVSSQWKCSTASSDGHGHGYGHGHWHGHGGDLSRFYGNEFFVSIDCCVVVMQRVHTKNSSSDGFQRSIQLMWDSFTLVFAEFD